jgi:hypothetical protein
MKDSRCFCNTQRDIKKEKKKKEEIAPFGAGWAFREKCE